MIFTGQRLDADSINNVAGRIAYKTATESVTSSTALQDDDQLLLSVVANGVYLLDAWILYDGAASPAGGLKLGFSGPAGATGTITNFGVNGGGIGGALTDYNVVPDSLGAAAPRPVGTNGAGSLMSCQPKGTITIGATAGDVKVRWAQQTSNATPTRVWAGSVLRLVRIS